MAASDSAAARPKRVRTGCLTCRARHLKCDEGKPDCMNCRKSNRQCKRGFRLNFIDTTVEQPPIILRDKDFYVHFLDESREIASEYAGGLEKYPRLSGSSRSRTEMQTPRPTNTHMMSSSMGMAPLPPMRSYLSTSPSSGSPAPSTKSTAMGRVTPTMDSRNNTSKNSYNSSAYITPPPSLPSGSAASTSSPLTYSPPRPRKAMKYLTSADETFFMQVFVEEVGIWMDSLDSSKHFSKQLPFRALDEPMLLNAFLACGAQHLSLVNPAYTKEKARSYNDVATNLLFKEIQKPNQDTALCATTSVILNVYEIMCNTPRERMNHIKGARTLVRTCGWDANSEGVGAACFWLNTTIEILTCLALCDYLTDDPDLWGVNMNFDDEEDQTKDEIWAHRIIYILAKVSNFRVDMKNGRKAPSAEAYAEWSRLKNLCDAWNESIPRGFHPMAHLSAFDNPAAKSAFPEVWIVKRIAIVARLFYHTALLILSQINPLPLPNQPPEAAMMATEHSTMICGIAAHVKDRGVASVTLRSLAIAAECLTNRREQEEVLKIFADVTRNTGWHTAFIARILKVKWGWEQPLQPPSVAINTSRVTSHSMITPITPPSAHSHLNMGTPLSGVTLPSSSVSQQSIQSLYTPQYSKPYEAISTPTSLPSSSPPMPLANPGQYLPTQQHSHQSQHQQHQQQIGLQGRISSVMNSQPSMFSQSFSQPPTLPSNAGQRQQIWGM